MEDKEKKIKFKVLTWFERLFSNCYNIKEVDKKMYEISTYIVNLKDELNGNIKIMDNKINDLEKTLEIRETFIKSLVVCRDQASMEKSNLMTTINKYKSKISEQSDLIKELEKVCANKTKIDADKTSSKLKEATNYILKMDKTNEKLLVNIEKLKKEMTDLKKSK